MNRRQMHRGWLGLVVLGVGGTILSPVTLAAEFELPLRTASRQPAASAPITPPAKDAKMPARPKWAEIEKTVQDVLAQTPGYELGDLLTREDVAPILAALKKQGWTVQDHAKLTARLLPASDELVRQLRTRRGKPFMREVGRSKDGYDRLDKLRALPHGRRRVGELIEQPGGADLIRYLATTPGGQRTGRELSSRNRGNFNAPTQRLYTEQNVLSALKELYEAETP